MNEVNGPALLVLCFILLVVSWSHCTAVDPLPENCRLETKPRLSDVKKWTFCINTTRDWSFDSKGTLCSNENDAIYITDFQLYQNDKTCPKTTNNFDPDLPAYNATCLQEVHKALAKNIAESIIKSFSGKKMSEVNETKAIQSDIQHLSSSTYRLVVDHSCHDRVRPDQNLDICDNTTRREMTNFNVDINLSIENFSNQNNVSECSCSISSTSNLIVLAVDVRLNHSNRLNLSPGKRILRQTELYWLLDGNLIPNSQEVNITLSGLETSIPDSVWLKVSGTNMTIICQTRSQIQRDTGPSQDDKIDMMLIIIIAVVSTVVTIIAIILICCICKYKRGKENKNVCKSPTTTPLVLGQVHKDHDEIVYSEPGKPVPDRNYSPKQNYFELENTYEEPTNPHSSSMNDHEDFAEDSVYNHLREKPDSLPSNIYNTTAKNEYSSFKRNAAGRQVIDNDYDI